MFRTGSPASAASEDRGDGSLFDEICGGLFTDPLLRESEAAADPGDRSAMAIGTHDVVGCSATSPAIGAQSHKREKLAIVKHHLLGVDFEQCVPSARGEFQAVHAYNIADILGVSGDHVQDLDGRPHCVSVTTDDDGDALAVCAVLLGSDSPRALTEAEAKLQDPASTARLAASARGVQGLLETRSHDQLRMSTHIAWAPSGAGSECGSTLEEAWADLQRMLGGLPTCSEDSVPILVPLALDEPEAVESSPVLGSPEVRKSHDGVDPGQSLAQDNSGVIHVPTLPTFPDNGEPAASSRMMVPSAAATRSPPPTRWGFSPPPMIETTRFNFEPSSAPAKLSGLDPSRPSSSVADWMIPESPILEGLADVSHNWSPIRTFPGSASMPPHSSPRVNPDSSNVSVISSSSSFLPRNLPLHRLVDDDAGSVSCMSTMSARPLNTSRHVRARRRSEPIKVPASHRVSNLCGTASSGGSITLSSSQVKRATLSIPVPVKEFSAPKAPTVCSGGRVHIKSYVVGAIFILVSFFGFRAGHSAVPQTIANDAGHNEAFDIRAKTEQALAQWEEHVSELNMRIVEISQDKVSDELRLARELREKAERHLHDCKAYGPDHC